MRNIPEDYCVVCGRDTDDLEEQVHENLRLGYEPFGSGYSGPRLTDGTYFIYQPMVQYKEEDPI